MKTLNKDLSIKEIGKITIDEAVEYKNKFLEYKILKDNIIVLRYFLNPFTRYSRFKGVVTKKLKQLYQSGTIKGNEISLLKCESVNSIMNYYYKMQRL